MPHDPDLCGPPEWKTPHLFRWRIMPGGAREYRCEYCSIPAPRDLGTPTGRIALPAPIEGLLSAVLQRVVAMLERIAIAFESRV